jgi:hypothetical protein
VTSCEQIIDRTQCSLGPFPSASFSCFWLYDSLTGDTGGCKAKDASLACGHARRPDQCPLYDVSSLGSGDCFWLYKGIETSGNEGSCIDKNDDLSCSVAKRENQCPMTDPNKFTNCIWISSGSGEDGNCETITLTCDAIGANREMCETPGAAVASNGTGLSCFWLYNETSGEKGKCRSKSDINLNCSEVSQERQCPLIGVTNLGSDNCLWLVGNATRIPKVVAQCKEKVFHSENNIRLINFYCRCLCTILTIIFGVY